VGDHLAERLDVGLEAELSKRIAKSELQEVAS
jgi:hypothetical protein